MDSITENYIKELSPKTREKFLKLLKKAQKDYDLRTLQIQNIQQRDL
jgi:hypothetical protein